jgi:hypothetical protein
MNKYEKLAVFLVRLLVVWLALLAIQSLVDGIIVISTNSVKARWAVLIRPALLSLAAFGLHSATRNIASYLGRDLGE